MKNVLNWIKGHLAVVILSVVILVLPIVGFIFSSGWNKGIHEQREKEVNELQRQLRGVTQLDYQGMTISPGMTATAFSGPPHTEYVDYFRNLRTEQRRQLDEVTSRIIEKNRRDRDVAVAGVLPEPQGTRLEQQKRLLDFAAAFIPSRESGSSSVYETLLRKELGAGGPPSPEIVAQAVSDLRISELEKISQQAGTVTERQNLEPELAQQLLDKLVSERISVLRQRATEISVYATMDIFQTASPVIPRERLSVPPTPEQCFEWQFDFWAVEDVLLAVAAANTDEAGQRTEVLRSPVKRIVSFSLAPRNLTQKAQDELEREQTPSHDFYGAPPAEDAPPIDVKAQPVEKDYRQFISGRWNGGSNPLYDVRYAYLDAVVSYEKLPRLIKAVSTSNFMEIVGVELSEINQAEHLREGYYYGDSGEYVVAARFQIEVLLFRDWTRPFMPDNIKKVLNIPLPEAPLEGEAVPGEIPQS